MLQLIVKTVLRVVLLFLPVALLSVGRDTFAAQSHRLVYLGGALVLLLLFTAALVFIGRAKRNNLSGSLRKDPDLPTPLHKPG